MYPLLSLYVYRPEYVIMQTCNVHNAQTMQTLHLHMIYVFNVYICTDGYNIHTYQWNYVYKVLLWLPPISPQKWWKTAPEKWSFNNETELKIMYIILGTAVPLHVWWNGYRFNCRHSNNETKSIGMEIIPINLVFQFLFLLSVPISLTITTKLKWV